MTARFILALIGIVGLTDGLAQDEVPGFEPSDCLFETEESLEGPDCRVCSVGCHCHQGGIGDTHHIGG